MESSNRVKVKFGDFREYAERLSLLEKIIGIPKLVYVDSELIATEWIDGKTLEEICNSEPERVNFFFIEYVEFAIKRLERETERYGSKGHGDLVLTNVIISENNRLFWIDMNALGDIENGDKKCLEEIVRRLKQCLKKT